jgi:hypothetical protein
MFDASEYLRFNEAILSEPTEAECEPVSWGAPWTANRLEVIKNAKASR